MCLRCYNIKPPAHLIASIYKKSGFDVQMNINGKYRKCEESGCEIYITCPYVRCTKHWKAMVHVKDTTMKEWT